MKPTRLNRRGFLLGGSALLGSQLMGTASAGVLSPVPISVHLMARLDLVQGEAISLRGLVAMEVLECIQQHPRAQQACRAMQAVLLRAACWVGASLLKLRERLDTIINGAIITQEALEEAVRIVIGPSEPLARQHLAVRIRHQLSPAQRLHFARRLVRRIDRAEARAERSVERGEFSTRTLETWAGILREQRDPVVASNQAGGDDDLPWLVKVLLIFVLMLGVAVVLGLVILLIGMSIGSTGMVVSGIGLMVVGLVVLYLIFGPDAAPEMAALDDDSGNQAATAASPQGVSQKQSTPHRSGATSPVGR